MRAFIIFLTLLMVVTNADLHVEAKKNKEAQQPVQVLPWKEVNSLIPKYSKFTVEDLETGMKFKVQRRAGSQHADVQPLTVKDTKIMKEIYNGKWSWKRRAIIVHQDGMKLAASMHGMPHGAGALKNNFPGHFCIHFYGSTTHRRNYMDLSHKLMVLKAGGKLQEYLNHADPYEITNSFIAGFKEQDEDILKYVSLQIRDDWDELVLEVENVAIGNMSVLPPEDLGEELSLDIPVTIDWFLKGRGGSKFRGSVHLIRFSPYDAWKVDTIKFIEENRLTSK